MRRFSNFSTISSGILPCIFTTLLLSESTDVCYVNRSKCIQPGLPLCLAEFLFQNTITVKVTLIIMAVLVVLRLPLTWQITGDIL